ncbi:MAG: DUF1326 domain-containing protein [Armatimonadetes bacterium]|nr:DUF1326 domain-containing protein [Armatimonadota bacterium]
MATQTAVDWAFEADYIQTCNCQYGCPCEFQAPPTEGFCEGVAAWHIHQGHYRDVDLSGVTFGATLHSPGPMHEGNLTLCLLIDERADERQRDAIVQIASGQAGGVPFEILGALTSEVKGPEFVPVQWQLDGRNSQVKLGDQVELATSAIKNPVTGDEEQIRVEHGSGFIFKDAEAVAGTRCASDVPGLAFSHPDRAGYVARVHYPY